MSNFLKIVFTLLYISVSCINDTSAQISDMIYNPYNMWLVGEDKLLINDIADNERTLKLFDFSIDSLKEVMRSGQGPGEVSPVYYKCSTNFSNGDILLWDAGRKRMMRYTSDLKYKTDLSGEASMFGNLYQAGLINDSTLLTVDFHDEFLKAWRINDNEISEHSLLWSIHINDYEELSPLSNFTLLQTLFYSNYGGMLYITFEFSSLIIGIDEDGIAFINSEPANIPLPPPDNESEKSGRYSLPIMGKHPEGARDISVMDDLVYVLLNGRTISKLEQMRYMVNFETLIDKVKHAERLLVYNRFTGEFINELKLPMPARQAKVQGEYVFLLNSLGDVPVIKKYKLSEL